MYRQHINLSQRFSKRALHLVVLNHSEEFAHRASVYEMQLKTLPRERGIQMPQVSFQSSGPQPQLQSPQSEIPKVRSRPRLGLSFITLSGIATLWIPVDLYWLAFVSGSFASAGLLFGTLILACAILGWLFPQNVRIIGVFSIILSVFSIIGALGGLVVGALLGIVGGALCIAWAPSTSSTSKPSVNPKRPKDRTASKRTREQSKEKGQSKSSWEKWF